MMQPSRMQPTLHSSARRNARARSQQDYACTQQGPARRARGWGSHKTRWLANRMQSTPSPTPPHARRIAARACVAVAVPYPIHKAGRQKGCGPRSSIWQRSIRGLAVFTLLVRVRAPTRSCRNVGSWLARTRSGTRAKLFCPSFRQIYPRALLGSAFFLLDLQSSSIISKIQYNNQYHRVSKFYHRVPTCLELSRRDECHACMDKCTKHVSSVHASDS